MRRLLLSAALLAAACNYASATTRRVLFLGNSYTYTNNMPLLLQQIATSMGDTLIYEEHNIGGYTLEGHSTNATSISKINAQAWDLVVLQEQSQRPAFSPGQVATVTLPYARKLDTLIRNHRACTETMFFMTWGYKNGDASNCVVYPPICTYAGMQQRLRESYLQMAQDNNGIVSPVGVAWKQVRDSFPAIELYSPDQSHPSVSGSYLAACVFYASIFHKNPTKSSFNSTVAAADAAILKRFAGRVVLDSFSNWNQYGNYVYAKFTKSVTGRTASFLNTSSHGTSYMWSFGDGGTSTTTSPVRAYASDGKYPVKLTASNSCFSETLIDTVIIGTGTGIAGIDNKIAEVAITAVGYGKLLIHNSSNTTGYNVEIIDINGRTVIKQLLNPSQKQTEELIPGTYMYRVSNGKAIYTNKLTVY